MGMERMENQDSFAVKKSDIYHLMIICDGMGGANGGSIASSLAVKSFCEYIDENAKDGMNQEQMGQLVKAASDCANQYVFDAATKDIKLFGMGTTLVCMLEIGGNIVCGNIGDSRAYLATEDGMVQITRDHSLVAEMVLRGELSETAAMHHPNKNVITRALGVDNSVECDIFKIDAKCGEFVLLCSDGLTNEVREPEIYYEVYQSQMPINACDTLVSIANSRGGRDNTTVLLASF